MDGRKDQRKRGLGKVTVAEFRKEKGLCEQWKEMLDTHALLRLVLFDVMESGHPARYTINGDNDGDISPTRASIELGTTRGYSMYGDRLKLLAVHAGKSKVEMPESEYAPEPQPEETSNARTSSPRRPASKRSRGSVK